LYDHYLPKIKKLKNEVLKLRFKFKLIIWYFVVEMVKVLRYLVLTIIHILISLGLTQKELAINLGGQLDLFGTLTYVQMVIITIRINELDHRSSPLHTCCMHYNGFEVIAIIQIQHNYQCWADIIQDITFEIL
jgi:hypothetical protein